MEPVGGPPLGNNFFVSLTCEKDVELPNLTETTTILMECIAFNGIGSLDHGSV